MQIINKDCQKNERLLTVGQGNTSEIFCSQTEDHHNMTSQDVPEVNRSSGSNQPIRALDEFVQMYIIFPALIFIFI